MNSTRVDPAYKTNMAGFKLNDKIEEFTGTGSRKSSVNPLKQYTQAMAVTQRQQKEGRNQSELY